MGDFDDKRIPGPSAWVQSAAEPNASFNPFPAPRELPAEPGSGSVIGFVKDYGNGKLYQYAAVHVAGKGWGFTGPRYAGSYHNWAAVLSFVGEENWSSIGVVSAWSRLAEFVRP